MNQVSFNTKNKTINDHIFHVKNIFYYIHNCLQTLIIALKKYIITSQYNFNELFTKTLALTTSRY